MFALQTTSSDEQHLSVSISVKEDVFFALRRQRRGANLSDAIKARRQTRMQETLSSLNFQFD